MTEVFVQQPLASPGSAKNLSESTGHIFEVLQYQRKLTFLHVTAGMELAQRGSLTDKATQSCLKRYIKVNFIVYRPFPS